MAQWSNVMTKLEIKTKCTIFSTTMNFKNLLQRNKVFKQMNLKDFKFNSYKKWRILMTWISLKLLYFFKKMELVNECVSMTIQ